MERHSINRLIKDALQARKEEGVKLGNPNGARALKEAGKGNAAALEAIRIKADAHARSLAPVIAEIRASGVTSLTGIAHALNAKAIPTARGNRWHPTSAKNLLVRIGSTDE